MRHASCGLRQRHRLVFRPFVRCTGFNHCASRRCIDARGGCSSSSAYRWHERPAAAESGMLIRGNSVTDVYTAGTRPTPAGAELLDLGTATILPGLIDCHTRAFLPEEVPAARLAMTCSTELSGLLWRGARNDGSARALEQGFTTIREHRNRGRGYGDVGIKPGDQMRSVPSPRECSYNSVDLHDRWLRARRICA